MHGFWWYQSVKLAPATVMKPYTQPEFVDFYLPFGGKLDPDNRWVKLAEMVPWELIEECYSKSLAKNGMGAPPLPARVAFGAMIIKERLGVTDEETVEQVFENVYLQYFLGYRETLKKRPFDSSMMVYFRSRFSQEDYDKINVEIIRMATAPETSDSSPDDSLEEDSPDPVTSDSKVAPTAEKETATKATKASCSVNGGKFLVDATATPADITYPTDLKLLNAVREKLEHIIDILHSPFIGKMKKPRTYRRKARRDFIAITKQKRPGAKKLRKAIGKQLRYIRRDLGHIDTLVDEQGADLGILKAYDYRCLLVGAEIYRQQLEMWKERKRRVDDRIVSLSQPWVRPIVRGKASAKTEFGAKISVGLAGGYTTLHRLNWDAYNECADLPGQVEAYHALHGYWPKSVHADKIYLTRANRAWCKERGIRLSAAPLGRPPAETPENAAELEAARKQLRQDEIDRNAIEGKFGNVKRKGSLARVMAKLVPTSVSVINIGIIVLNLDTRLRELFACLYIWIGQLVDPHGRLSERSLASGTGLQ